MGGDGTLALAKPQLVHEMPERTAVAAGQAILSATPATGPVQKNSRIQGVNSAC